MERKQQRLTFNRLPLGRGGKTRERESETKVLGKHQEKKKNKMEVQTLKVNESGKGNSFMRGQATGSEREERW